MDRVFTYEDGDDSELYFDEMLVDDLGVRISACTVANGDSKPNEDALAVAKNGNVLWIGVFDGTTSLRPLEKLKGVSGARFASHFLRDNFISTGQESQISPGELLLKLNEKLLDCAKGLGGQLNDTHSLPASMATVVKIDPGKLTLEFAHIGDTYAVVYAEGNLSLVLTEDRNKKFDDGMFELIKEVAVRKGITNRQARQEEEVKKALYEMFIKRNNNPDGTGSGVVNGDPNASLYMQTGKLDLAGKKSVLIATDGLEIQGKNIEDESYRNFLRCIFEQGGFHKLIDSKRESEDKDQNWNNVRYKHSDDATGVMVSLY